MKLDSSKIIYFILKHFEIDISIFDDGYISKMIESSMNKFDLNTSDDFIDHLKSNENNFTQFYNTLSNGYSLFFREDLSYSLLYSKIIPELIDSLDSDDELRIWSVACSKGQEAYSIAILCEDLKVKKNIDFKYRIIATDISKPALEKAEKGIYDTSDMLNTKYKYIISYFDKVSNDYHIKKEIKKNVYFSEYNIVTSESKYPPESIYGNFDIVICNNLMIYYNNKVKEEILGKLFSSVNIDGYFITSEAEIAYVTRIIKDKAILCQSPILKKTRK